MADKFVVEYSDPEFQRRLRKACQDSCGDLQKEARQRHSLCDPIQLRVISNYGFPPSEEGVKQCLAEFAKMLPGNKELQELNWRLAGLVHAQVRDWGTQFVACCALDVTPEHDPPLLPALLPVTDLTAWEEPDAGAW